MNLQIEQLFNTILFTVIYKCIDQILIIYITKVTQKFNIFSYTYNKKILTFMFI